MPTQVNQSINQPIKQSIHQAINHDGQYSGLHTDLVDYLVANQRVDVWGPAASPACCPRGSKRTLVLKGGVLRRPSRPTPLCSDGWNATINNVVRTQFKLLLICMLNSHSTAQTFGMVCFAKNQSVALTAESHTQPPPLMPSCTAAS